MSVATAVSVPMLTAGDAKIPAIGLGTSNLGGKVRGENVATALKLGYRHIDTAWKYGSEPEVGEGIRASGVPRGEIFLCTKVSHEYLRADDFARSVDESLKNLGVDYVDLLLVHWPNKEIPLKETMGALAKAKRDGLARHIGVANFNIALLDEAIALCPEPLVDAAGRVSSVYRHRRRSLDACRRARHRLHRLLPARARAAVRRSGARRDRQGQGQDDGAGGAALADPAGKIVADPALVESGAHGGKPRRVRVHARRRRDGAHRRVASGPMGGSPIRRGARRSGISLDGFLTRPVRSILTAKPRRPPETPMDMSVGLLDHYNVSTRKLQDHPFLRGRAGI